MHSNKLFINIYMAIMLDGFKMSFLRYALMV